MGKRTKYKILQHLPGRTGRRYWRKLQAANAPREFKEALGRCENKVCIDLGVNVGEYTRQMALAAKEVIAFEPDPWAHTQLQKNVSDLTNVKVENAAASTDGGTILLWRHKDFMTHPAEYSISSSLMSSKFEITEKDQAVEVRTVNFLEYLDDLEGQIGIIKMDIEDAEIDILEALLERSDILPRIDHIFVETHERHFADHVARVESLVRRTSSLKHPHFNLFWH